MYLKTVLGNKHNIIAIKESLKCSTPPGEFPEVRVGGIKLIREHILLLPKMVTFL